MASSMRRAFCVILATAPALFLRAEPISADHGGARVQPNAWDPALIAMLSGVLVLTIVVAVAIIKVMLAKKTPPPE